MPPPMVHTRGLLAGTLVALMVLLTVPTQAQLPPEFLDVEVSYVSTGIEDDGRVGIFEITVTNPTQSPFPSDVSLTVTEPPAGWAAQLSDTSFQLAGGDSAISILRLEAAEDADETEAMVTVTATATYTSPIPGTTPEPATASVEVPHSFERDFISAFEHAVGISFWLVVILLLVLLAVAAWFFSRRSSPLELHADEQLLQVPAGSLAVLPVRVHNPGGRATKAKLDVTGIPDGWKVDMDNGEIDLPPRQNAVVQVQAMIPSDAPGGVRELSVLASQPDGGQEARASLAVEVRPIVKPKPEAKPAPAPEIIPEVKPEAKVEPAPETLSEIKPASKPAPVIKAEPKAPAASKPTKTLKRAKPATKAAATGSATKAAAPKPASKAPATPAAPTFSDYAGASIAVEDLEGIGPVYGERLRAAGIHSTARLSYESAEAVAKAAQVPVKTAQQWQSMVELMKIKGVGPQYAEALTRAGVKDIASLKRRKPDAIASQVTKYLDSLDTTVVGKAVTPKRVESWQAAAKSMRKSKQPVPEQ